MEIDVVIVAAGGSQRFGGDKLVAALEGEPVIAWSMRAFAAIEGCGRVVVVTNEERRETFETIGTRVLGERFRGVVIGGSRRRDSVEAGLRACRSTYVAIHDGARPLVTAEVIARCLAAAANYTGEAVPVVPVTDSVKVVAGDVIGGNPDRSRLFAAQTPQVIHRQAWLAAAAAGDGDETDDAAMVDRLGLKVGVVEGDPENIKVTRPIDLKIARLILAARKGR